MPMIQKNLDDIGARYAAFVDALRVAMNDRVIKTDLEHISEQPAADITKGIWTVISDGESNYRNTPGLKATEGQHRLILVGHLKVPEAAKRSDIQEKEFAMTTQLKAFVRSGVPRMTINLQSIRGSRQLEHPYGWLYAELTLGPAEQGTH